MAATRPPGNAPALACRSGSKRIRRRRSRRWRWRQATRGPRVGSGAALPGLQANNMVGVHPTPCNACCCTRVSLRRRACGAAQGAKPGRGAAPTLCGYLQGRCARPTKSTWRRWTSCTRSAAASPTCRWLINYYFQSVRRCTGSHGSWCSAAVQLCGCTPSAALHPTRLLQARWHACRSPPPHPPTHPPAATSPEAPARLADKQAGPQGLCALCTVFATCMYRTCSLCRRPSCWINTSGRRALFVALLRLSTTDHLCRGSLLHAGPAGGQAGRAVAHCRGRGAPEGAQPRRAAAPEDQPGVCGRAGAG